MRDFEDLLIEDLELTLDDWQTLTPWAKFEKLAALSKTANQTIWAASSRISDLEDAIIDAQDELLWAENDCTVINPIVCKLRQDLLIDPCPGQLPIKFPRLKQRKRKSA
jgi:hypothetical protein